MTNTILLILLLILTTVLLGLTAVLLSRSGKGDGNTESADRLLKGVYDIERGLNTQNETLRQNVDNALEKIRIGFRDFSESNTQNQIGVIKAVSDLQTKTAENAARQTREIAAAIEKMQNSNEKKLEEMRLTVDEKLNSTLSQRLDSSFRTVSEQLSKVYTSLGEMKEISGGITSLNRVLNGVKTRGNWAEAQLETILDQIIPGMYVKNYSPGDGREVVEFAVKIPAADLKDPDIFLPIDSKFPMENYLRLCDASDEGNVEGIKEAKKALEAGILGQAREVSKYIQPPATTPFAVLYLATDSLYAEIVSSKSNIADTVHTKYRVLLAGPSTVTALLSAIASGYRTAALNAKAAEVMELLATAKAQYDKFGEAIDKARKKLEEAGKSLDDVDKRNDIIVRKLRAVESLGDGQVSDNLLTD